MRDEFRQRAVGTERDRARAMRRRDQGRFRFALFGRVSGGKTAILCALSMPRLPHPAGYTCTRPALTRELGEDESFVRGEAWLEKNTARLAVGEATAPNPIEQTDLSFHYELVVGERQRYQIYLFDYAGELLTSEASESKRAEQLRQLIAEMDGILILAEYPRDAVGAPTAELHDLGAVFALLGERDALFHRPVAVLVNKWDRRVPLLGELRDMEVQQTALRDFLGSDPPPPHVFLRDQLRGVAGDRLKFFPVSAFGEAELKPSEGGVSEAPRLVNGMLQSFGLEDPFIWMIEEVQSLRAADLANELQSLKTVPILSLCWPFSANKIARKARQTLGVLPLGAASRHTIREVQDRATALWRWSLGFPAILTCVLGIVAWLWFNQCTSESEARRLMAYLKNVETCVEDAVSTEERLRQMASTEWYQYPLCDKNLLEKSINESRARREEDAWQRYSRAGDPITALKAGKAYLSAFPGGDHAKDVRRVVDESESQSREAEQLAFLNTLEAGLKPDTVLSPERRTDNLERARGEMQKYFQYNEPVSDTVRSKKNGMIADIANGLADARRQFDHEQCQNSFYKLLEQRDALAAGQLVIEMIVRSPDDDRFKGIADHFKERGISVFERQVTDTLRGGRQCEEARNLIDEFTDKIVKQSKGLRVEVVPQDAIKTLEALRKDVEKQWDRHLYERLCKGSPSSDDVNAYMNGAPLKTMSVFVDEYRKWLTARRQPHDLRLILKTIRWGDGVNERGHNDVHIWIGDRELQKMGPFRSKRGELLRPEGFTCMGLWSAKDSVKLRVEIRDYQGLGWDWFEGRQSAEHSLTIDGWAWPREGTLQIGDGQGGRSELVFTIEGLPAEPLLPREWREN